MMDENHIGMQCQLCITKSGDCEESNWHLFAGNRGAVCIFTADPRTLYRVNEPHEEFLGISVW
jgi:hypothetical protein